MKHPRAAGVIRCDSTNDGRESSCSRMPRRPLCERVRLPLASGVSLCFAAAAPEAVDVPRLVLHFDSSVSWSSRARARGQYRRARGLRRSGTRTRDPRTPSTPPGCRRLVGQAPRVPPPPPLFPLLAVHAPPPKTTMP
uniref:Uncharacterized protein n=1 Tax=Oryza sativa subsp. japonica TaxID=39947 RepID=Q69QE6_ORYSJ|nr:hypothetical protein [Oryza sativa Japonica Group]